ncbi:PH domain-containing protein [Nicoliella lavandulae]|uniref:PH domain-containing protein n=1 Tax=Nicoliella lavandulae TaxID=3082954 RepID=A0ABU8SJC5_9LACO
MQNLPPRVKKVWFLSTMVQLLILIIIAGGYVWLTNNVSWAPKWGLSVIGFIIVVIIGFELALIPYRYRFHQFAVNETEVEIKNGFFFRSHVSIPIARVQNVDINQGPLLRTQKLFEVDIATGGSTHSIDGLNRNDADRVKERVMQLALEAKNAQ